ncbi:MAG TPA: response regulator transcription factor [Actinomycetota bacterium]|nr:response regulator transcription factor [Actinomycetota bacterium]
MSARVMVVDDTEHVRRMLVDILRLHGFDIAGECANGVDAVAEVEALAPDVVVMDYKMPGMDGVEATRRVRERIPEQPVILYSAYIDHELEMAAKDAGVAACVRKGAGVEALAREISALVLDLGHAQ